MSPANIEAALKAQSPLIAQAVAIGDGRPYVSALLVLDPDAGVRREDERLMRDLQAAVDRANASLAGVEQVRRFAVIDDVWEPGSELLTPTMKLKRRGIAARYAHEIDALYDAEARPDAR
jgi:long-subunit acyl-CoA synthetase (AMP-forming)